MTVTQLTLMLNGVDGATVVSFKALKTMTAGSVVVLSMSAEIDGENVTRSVASGSIDKIIKIPAVILQG